jgi:hypothetical protein
MSVVCQSFTGELIETHTYRPDSTKWDRSTCPPTPPTPASEGSQHYERDWNQIHRGAALPK